MDDNLLQKIKQIGENIKTQNNDCTAHPLFFVQSRRRIYGVDTDYCEDNVCWVHEDGYDEVSKEESLELEKQYDEHWTIPDGYNRVGYVDIWETKTACLTRAGAEDYIRANGHNLKEPSIYVESGYRNQEIIDLREFLKKL